MVLCSGYSKVLPTALKKELGLAKRLAEKMVVKMEAMKVGLLVAQKECLLGPMKDREKAALMELYWD